MSSATAHKDQDPNRADSLLAGIERGACFGTCPEFKVLIYKSGFAQYYGKRNAPRLGYYTSRLTAEQTASIVDLIRTHHMEDKDSAYVNKYLADYPAYTLWIGDRKPSRHILISDDQPPAELAEFTDLFEREIVKADWRLSGKDE